VRTALESCSPDARRLVQAAAVLGRPTAPGVVARLAEVEQAYAAALEEAVAARLMAHGPSGHIELRLRDPMVRAAVLDAMGAAEVTWWSRRAADAVTDDAHRLQLLVAASPLPDAALADALDEAAGTSAAEGAWGTAAALWIDAGRITEDQLMRERRLTRAADALVGAGDARGAAALAPELQSLRETPMRNAVLGYLAIVRGRASEAESRLDRAWSLVNRDREPDVAASICQRYVLHHLARCRPRELVSWADEAVALAAEDDPAGVEAQAIRGLGLAALGRLDEAVATYRDLTAQVPSGAQLQRVTMGRGWLDLMRGHVQDARADLESAVPTTFHGGSARISLWARAWLARAQFLLGDWDAALGTVTQGVALLDRTGIVLSGPLLRWTAVQVHALRGEWPAAEEALRQIDAETQEYEIMRIPASLAHATLAEARTDYDGVLRALQPLAGAWAHEGVDDPGQWPWQDVYANALVVEGHLEEAERFLAPREARARERGQHVVLARLGYPRGRLLGARGDLAGACRVFDDSLATLDGRPLRYDRARVGFAYGQTLRRAGRRGDADAVMSTARDLFISLGAQTYVARCDRELKAGGVRAQRTGRGFADLTPQEEAVTALVAQGLSNREVATELFLSVKTVQYHLTRVYAKLGIRSRSELAAHRAPGAESHGAGS
jgi:DNA-binding CsgD family transcriptional regulator